MAASLLVRIAGLPASSLDSFGGEACRRCFDGLDRTERELAAVRAEMVEALQGQIPLLPADLRGFFLALKRDCHNGRSLRRHRAAPGWEAVRLRTGPLADRLAAAEEREKAAAEELDRAFAAELDRELRALWRLADDPGFRRGLALASPSLFERLGHRGPREQRLALGLLRYMSRAALKLSPYSTFTRVGLGDIQEKGGELRLLGDPAEWRERSLVRLRRYLIEQISHLLLGCPAVRSRTTVRLNPTLEPLENTGAGLYRLVRPGSWSIAEIPVAGELVVWLEEQGNLEAGDLEALLAGVQGGSRESARSLLDKLLQIGLLVLEPLWAGEHPRLEEAIAEALRGLALPDEALAEAAAGLGRIVELEEGFCRSEDPAGAVRKMQRELEGVWRAARSAAGQDGGTAQHRNQEVEIFEDVVVHGVDREEVAAIPRSAVEDALRCAEPWLRLMDLQGTRLEALRTLAGAFRRRWPDRDEMSVLALFQEVHGLLPDSRSDPPQSAEVWRELPGLVRRDGEDCRIDPGELAALLARVPPGASPGVGPCVFLQPADAAGRRWVMNRIFEGTGRYGSRFLVTLPDAARHRLIAELAARSGELVDLFWPHGDTLNAHAIQTARVLVFPGDRVDLPAGRRVELRDLRVRIDAETGLPWLAAAHGERVRPVFLGGASLSFAPPLLRFLALFGPGELKPIPLPRQARAEEDIQILDRLLLGRLVLGRKRWVLPAGPLRDLVAASSPPRAWRAVERWWRARGLPLRMFIIERVRHEVQEEVYKPQFVDLASPLFFQLFAGIVRAAGATLVIEEVLPGPEELPRDARGRRWAVEVQVDAMTSGGAR